MTFSCLRAVLMSAPTNSPAHGVRRGGPSRGDDRCSELSEALDDGFAHAWFRRSRARACHEFALGEPLIPVPPLTSLRCEPIARGPARHVTSVIIGSRRRPRNRGQLLLRRSRIAPSPFRPPSLTADIRALFHPDDVERSCEECGYPAPWTDDDLVHAIAALAFILGALTFASQGAGKGAANRPRGLAIHDQAFQKGGPDARMDRRASPRAALGSRVRGDHLLRR